MLEALRDPAAFYSIPLSMICQGLALYDMILFLLVAVCCTAVVFAIWLALGRNLGRDMKPTGGDEARPRKGRNDRPPFTGTDN